jgi:hypothetical protein
MRSQRVSERLRLGVGGAMSGEEVSMSDGIEFGVAEKVNIKTIS